MSDNKSKTAANRKRINVHDRQELHYWSHRLGVSPEELKRAVSKAGVMADDVARVLGKLWLLKYIHRRTTLHSEPRSNRARARFFQKWMLVGAWRVSALGHSRTNSAAHSSGVIGSSLIA